MAKVDCVGCIHSVVCQYRSRNEQPWIKEHCKLVARDARPHGEWISKPKRIQVDETDEERIFETCQEWFCSSCGKSFGFRKPEDAFCKYCGSDNRPRENNSSSMIINGKYSENVEYGTRVEIRKKGGE